MRGSCVKTICQISKELGNLHCQGQCTQASLGCRKKEQGRIQEDMALKVKPEVKAVVEGKMVSKVECEAMELGKKHLHKLENKPEAKCIEG